MIQCKNEMLRIFLGYLEQLERQKSFTYLNISKYLLEIMNKWMNEWQNANKSV